MAGQSVVTLLPIVGDSQMILRYNAQDHKPKASERYAHKAQSPLKTNLKGSADESIARGLTIY